MKPISNKEQFKEFLNEIADFYTLSKEDRREMLNNINAGNINDRKSIIALVLGIALPNRLGKDLCIVFDVIEATFND